MTEPTITIPDALPVLSRGNHHPGDGKACIMDAVSIISGKPWELDTPSCVLPALREVFIRVNDTCDDDERHRLWKPALRAMGTATGDEQTDQRLHTALLIWAIRRQLVGKPVNQHPVGARILRALHAQHEHPCRQHRIALHTSAYLRTDELQSTLAHQDDCCGCDLAVTVIHTKGPGVLAADVQRERHPGGMTAQIAWLNDALDELERLSGTHSAPPAVPWTQLRHDLGTVAAAT